MTDTAAPPARDADIMIRLERVSKRYPGQSVAAVSELSLDIRAGETVVLLGPSGCGKTTTLRLINRLIEPSSGRIFIEGEDVTSVDPDKLRRRIGYVIQQVGLFPHMTVAGNIGLIPRTLGWNKKRIQSRVDELLDLVGLDPSAFRSRYPKQLSGGQQQRVGVARALAADPPVMLMDEPFGAIDPINRERLQDEFLKLQARIGKTIVIVTHDVAEAIKLGDRIAIFGEGATLAQYDTPAATLAAPANEFVASFLGGGAAVRGLGLRLVDTVALEPVELVHADTGSPTGGGTGHALVVDDAGNPRCWLHPSPGDPAGDPARPPALVRRDQTLYDALDAMLRAGADIAVVTDERGQAVGVLSWSAVMRESQGGPAASPVETVNATGSR